MALKEITVGIKRLINLGNYENVSYECVVTSTIEINEQSTQVYNEALNFAKQKIGIELDRFSTSIPIKELRSKMQIMDDEIPF